jgi:ribonuclease BN (tRNA processing enzyme)
MRIKVLGSGTAVQSLSRTSSSYLVTAGGQTILIDIGPSVARRLLEYGFSGNEIDVIALTHFHVDHTADLSTFLFTANYGAVERRKPLTILGGPGIHRFYGRLRSLYPWVVPKTYDLTIRAMPQEAYSAQGVTIEAKKVNHNRESIALKISDTRSIVFSGDTDYSRNLVALAKGADLLVAECAFPEKKVKGHLNLVLLEKIVNAAKPLSVLLSHLYPEWDQFRGVLHSPFLLAEDGLEIEV